MIPITVTWADFDRAVVARVKSAAIAWLKDHADELECTHESYFVPGQGREPSRYRRREEP